MGKRRGDNASLNIAFLDLLSGALGAVIILFIAVPKGGGDNSLAKKMQESMKKNYVKVIETSNSEKTVLKMEIKDLKKKLSESKKQYDSSLEKMQKELKSSMAATEKNERVVASIKKPDNHLDIGFKFKGKNIVFVIDVSGSMSNEDRIGQVKAGLKMLIHAMGDDYNVDVIYYPDTLNGNLYKPLYGGVNSTVKSTKDEIFSFLHKLTPYGPTPTKAVLLYVLGNYDRVSDIVLLSDGSPTKGFSKKLENINSILKEVKRLNVSDVQINTIGVGSDFLNDKTNDRYIFLSKLAKNSSGFFIGF